MNGITSAMHEARQAHDTGQVVHAAIPGRFHGYWLALTPSGVADGEGACLPAGPPLPGQETVMSSSVQKLASRVAAKSTRA